MTIIDLIDKMLELAEEHGHDLPVINGIPDTTLSMSVGWLENTADASEKVKVFRIACDPEVEDDSEVDDDE